MRLPLLLLGGLFACLMGWTPALAQMSGVRVVAACGAPAPWPALSAATTGSASAAWLAVDPNYNLCTNGTGVAVSTLTAGTTPTGGFTAGQLLYSDGALLQAATTTYAAPGILKTSAYVSNGTLPTTTTGTCTATSANAGGATAGTFVAPVCAAGTIILTALPAAPTGYACAAFDRTNPGTTDTLAQTASSTTSATFKATTVAADVIQFQCTGY